MATNLVSLAMQFLTPDIIRRIAAALGLDRSSAQTAISAAIPSLLAGFSGLSAQPGGAQQLTDAVSQQTGTLEGFARVLGGGNQSSFIEQGSQILSALLGSQQQGALAGAIGRFAGIGQGATQSLLGMLAPVVLGTIAQQQGTTRLDPGRIAGLLAGQKDNIAAALPSGLSSLLAGSGLLNSLDGAARTAAAASNEVTSASVSATRAAGDAARSAVGASGSNYWPYWLIPVAAVAALVVYLLARPTEQVAQSGPTVGQNTMVASLDVDRQVSDTIDGLRTTLSSITDTASAQAALPKLQEAVTKIDKVNALRGQLSVDQRKALTSLVNPAIPTLNQLFDKALAVPGASDELKPTVDALRAKFAALSA